VNFLNHLLNWQRITQCEFTDLTNTTSRFISATPLQTNRSFAMNTRRNFLYQLAVTASTPVVLASTLCGQAPPPPAKLEETDPVAIALGYKEDSTKVDATKYPNHKPEQLCSNCVLYQGKAGEASGPCAAVGGKLVTAPGWCSVYAKKPEAAK
jgi:hypothetical protein